MVNVAQAVGLDRRRFVAATAAVLGRVVFSGRAGPGAAAMAGLGGWARAGRGRGADRRTTIGAQSLCLGASQLPLAGYFPLGFVLGENGVYEQGFERLIPLGFNESQTIIVPWAGGDSPAMPAASRSGLWLVCCWSAYVLGQIDLATFKTRWGRLPAAVDANGQPAHSGASVFSRRTRRYLVDRDANCVAANLKGWSGQSDRVRCWGIDNEWNLPLDYSPVAKRAFRRWLAATYHSVAALNAAWGRHYSTFGQAEPPGPGPGSTMYHYTSFDLASAWSPNYAAWLDWHAFQEASYAATVAERFSAIRAADPARRPVVSKNSDWTIEDTIVAKAAMVDLGLVAEKIRSASGGLMALDSYQTGEAACYLPNYVFHCIRPLSGAPGYGVFLSETNDGAPSGRAFARTYWRLPSNGLKAVNYFCLGGVGDTGDYAADGFVTPTGRMLPKLYYAARWANMIHRTERFWTEARPRPAVPRVAILMPHRDVMIAPNPAWRDYSWAPIPPLNNRIAVFGWLREQGYWVDVIPYQKLHPGYLASYGALLLIGADHLTADECAAIADYVRSGGCVLADTAAGYFDEHHRVHRGLDEVLGVQRRGVDINKVLRSRSRVAFATRWGQVAGEGRVRASLTTAELLYPSSQADRASQADRVTAGTGRATRNRFGRGMGIWLNTQLGTLRSAVPAAPAMWLAELLRRAGVRPAYEVARFAHVPAVRAARQLRLEQPYVNAAGSCVLTVANARAQALPALTVELPRLEESGGAVWWAPAETASLERLPVEPLGGPEHRCTIELPAVASAGVIYLLRNGPPLLGFTDFTTGQTGRDGATPLVSPGTAFRTAVQLVNPMASPLPAGTLRLAVPQGWQAEPCEITTALLPADQEARYGITITLSPETLNFRPEWLYPLVARWSTGASSGSPPEAICTAHVQVRLSAAQVPRLLSDNPGWKNYRYRIRTGCARKLLVSRVHDTAVVLFDLKRVYEVNRIRIHSRAVLHFSVAASRDGRCFAQVDAGDVMHPQGLWEAWLVSRIFRAQGRYLRVTAKLRPGEKLDPAAVEVWGRTSTPGLGGGAG